MVRRTDPGAASPSVKTTMIRRRTLGGKKCDWLSESSAWNVVARLE
jgi:hypothetical protein